MKNEYEQICELIENLSDSITTLEDSTDFLIRDIYDLPLSIKDVIAPLSDEDINNLTEENIDQYFMKDGKLVNIKDNYDNSEFEGTLHEYKIHILLEIRKALLDVKDSKNKFIEFEKQKAEIAKSYIEYLNSPEYLEKRKQQIEELKTKYENETDPYEKEKLKKALNVFNELESLSFLFKRFWANEEDEKRSLMMSFFDTNRGSYVIKRYSQKCKKLNIPENTYQQFLNLEEKYLDEEYHPYNNLFLFFVMRYIAYIDVYSQQEKMFAISLILNMHKLVYNEFSNDDAKQTFINIIKAVSDYFKDDKEYFINNNVTYSKHPKNVSSKNINTESNDENLK